MTTITKEQIEMYASAAEATQTFEMDKGKLVCVEPEHMLELARIALASLEAEAVFEVEVSGNHWLNAGPVDDSDFSGMHDGVNQLYSAPPAPVSVPDDVMAAMQKVARIRLDLNDFDGDKRGILDCLSDAEEALIEVVNRRAAMLQSLGNSEQLSSPVTPDQPLAWKVIFTMHGQPGSNFKKIFDDEVAMESAVSLHRSGGFNVQVIPLIAHQNQ